MYLFHSSLYFFPLELTPTSLLQWATALVSDFKFGDSSLYEYYWALWCPRMNYFSHYQILIHEKNWNALWYPAFWQKASRSCFYQAILILRPSFVLMVRWCQPLKLHNSQRAILGEQLYFLPNCEVCNRFCFLSLTFRSKFRSILPWWHIWCEIYENTSSLNTWAWSL